MTLCLLFSDFLLRCFLTLGPEGSELAPVSAAHLSCGLLSCCYEAPDLPF